MKPSPKSSNTNNLNGAVDEESEGSTLDVKREECGSPTNHSQNFFPSSPFSQKNQYNNKNHHNHNMAQFHQQSRFPTNLLARTEAYIEAQVMQLTNECRLFQEDETEEDDNKCSNLALFQRHEIQTSWSLVGNGAFSEVYTVQSIHLLDGGFVDPIQQEARENLRDCVAKGHMVVKHSEQQQPQQEEPRHYRQFVVKHLRRDLLSNRKKFIHAAGDLVLEAMYLSKLHHPNIISLCGCTVGGPSAYGDGRHDGFFLVLEKLDCTLSQKIQLWERLVSSGRCATSARTVYSKDLLDFEEKLDLAHQVGLALEYLHGKDIIFRDLKPDNIGILELPNGKSVVKLFDFGLCRELPEATPKEDRVFHMSGVGTRRYMAPEVFLGQYYNVKADVYSWTMCLHAMLSLQRPFEMYNADLHKLLVCQEGVRPTIYKDWPQDIQQLLRNGWAANPMNRPRMGQICSTIAGLMHEILAIKREKAENDPLYATSQQEDKNNSHRSNSTFMEQSITSFVDSLTSNWCTGSQDHNNNNNKGTRRSARSLLRTLEAHLVADAAGTQLLMMRDKPHNHFRDRVGADYPQIRHLRSSYL